MSASYRGASGESVAALTDKVEQVTGSGQDAGRVAGELFALALAVRGEGSLRRFLTDGSVPAEAKSGLVVQVFGGKVGPTSLDLVRDAVARRWVSARDLADALEHLSVVAAVRSAGSESGRLADELFGVAQLVKDNPEVRDALSDPARDTRAKEGLIDALLGGKTLPATVALAKQALSGSYRTVSAALADYQRVAADVHGQGVAVVRVARALTDAETRRLNDALARQYDRPVHLNVIVDPSVLGGVRVEIGDDVIDGTVSSRLDDARRKLAG